jgi:hypothetical protein
MCLPTAVLEPTSGENDDVRRGEVLGVGGDSELRRTPELFARYLAGRIDVAAIARDFLRAQVVSDRAKLLAELDGKRQTDIAEPHHSHHTHVSSLFDRRIERFRCALKQYAYPGTHDTAAAGHHTENFGASLPACPTSRT